MEPHAAGQAHARAAARRSRPQRHARGRRPTVSCWPTAPTWPPGSFAAVVVDLAPTILYYLGVPVGRDMDGFRADRPVSARPTPIEHPMTLRSPATSGENVLRLRRQLFNAAPRGREEVPMPRCPSAPFRVSAHPPVRAASSPVPVPSRAARRSRRLSCPSSWMPTAWRARSRASRTRFVERNRGVEDLALVGIRAAACRSPAPARRATLQARIARRRRADRRARHHAVPRRPDAPRRRPAAGRPPHRRSRFSHRRPADPAGRRRALHRPDDPGGARRAHRLRPAAAPFSSSSLVDRGHRELPIRADYVGTQHADLARSRACRSGWSRPTAGTKWRWRDDAPPQRCTAATCSASTI